MDKIEGENVKIIWTVRTYSFRGQFIEPIPTSHDLSESCNSVSKLVTTFVVNSVTGRDVTQATIRIYFAYLFQTQDM